MVDSVEKGCVQWEADQRQGRGGDDPEDEALSSSDCGNCADIAGGAVCGLMVKAVVGIPKTRQRGDSEVRLISLQCRQTSGPCTADAKHYQQQRASAAR